MLFNRLLTIFLACVLVLPACDRDIGITDQLLFKENPDVLEEASVPSEIPDWLKEKIWHDEDALIGALLALNETDTEEAIELSNQIASRQKQDWFYRKWINAGGIAIISTWGVENAELEVARDIILTMTAKHPELRQHKHMDTGFYMVLYDSLRYTLRDLPEYHDINWGRAPVLASGVCGDVCIAPSGGINRGGQEINTRIKYQGKTCEELGNWTSGFGYWCGRVGLYQNNYATIEWDTFVHEFAHAMHSAIFLEDPKFDTELMKSYKNAVAKELWTVKADRYAAKNFQEYWAVNTEYWFIPKPSAEIWRGEVLLEIPEMSQKTLKELDPKLYRLMAEWYPATEFVPLPSENN